VECFDSDGAGYIAIFAGQSAELRARDYYDAIERGALNTRIADAQIVTPKPDRDAKDSRLFSTKTTTASALRRPSVGAPRPEWAWQSPDMWLG
jgi:hypothetical protein